MKTQKLTTGEILRALKGLSLFGQADRPGDVAMDTFLIVDAIEAIGKGFEKINNEYFEKWGLKRQRPGTEEFEFVPVPDEKSGKPVYGSKQIAPEHMDEYAEAVKLLEAVEVEVNTPTITISKGMMVAPNILRMIRPFIEFSK